MAFNMEADSDEEMGEKVLAESGYEKMGEKLLLCINGEEKMAIMGDKPIDSEKPSDDFEEILRCMPSPTAVWHSRRAVKEHNWEGWEKIPTVGFPVVWVLEGTCVRMRHKEVGWYYLQAGYKGLSSEDLNEEEALARRQDEDGLERQRRVEDAEAHDGEKNSDRRRKKHRR